MKYNWRKVLMSPDASLSEAIEVLDREALRIILVVDNDNRLLGTITDGDVRRALIRHCQMDTPASEVMFKTPRVVKVNDSRASILGLMKAHDLLHIPILDDRGVVVGMETLQRLTDRPCYDTPVVLMAGGLGKRLRPLTFDTPKPLLKVGNKPILESILENFVDSGFHNFYISVHYMADQVKSHFGKGEKWGVNIEYIDEKEPLGTAGALGLLPENMPSLPLILMNGDLLTKVNFEQLVKYHEGKGGVATMCVREYDLQVPYGVVEANEHCIEQIVEKPVQKFFVNAGIYVVSPELYRSVKKGERLDMPKLLQDNIENNQQVNMFPLHEYWLDIGRMEDYESAQIVDV